MNRLLAKFPALATALVFMTSAPAMAAGTAAGTQITNSASISFAVNAVTQSVNTTAPSVTVDRLINLVATPLVSLPITVTPGQYDVTIPVRVTNLSNAPVTIQANSLRWRYGPNEPTGLLQVMDTNYNGIYDPPSNYFTYEPAKDLHALTLPRKLPVIQPDASITIFVLADFYPYETFPNKAEFTEPWLFYTKEPNDTGDQDMPRIVATSGANTSGVDTVFADTGLARSPDIVNTQDEPRDGAVSLDLTYVIFTANFTTTRTFRVISDPVNGTTDPKAIPGALVEYCMAISNAADAATATDLAIADALDPNTTFDNTFGVFQGGTVTNGVCDTDGPAGGANGGTFANGQINATIASLAAGETKTVRYRAYVN